MFEPREPVRPGDLALLTKSRYSNCLFQVYRVGEVYSGYTDDIWHFLSEGPLPPDPMAQIFGHVARKRDLLKISPDPNQFTKETEKEVEHEQGTN